jgi:hypothetical protein
LYLDKISGSLKRDEMSGIMEKEICKLASQRSFALDNYTDREEKTFNN